jgi:hypothetical protein
MYSTTLCKVKPVNTSHAVVGSCSTMAGSLSTVISAVAASTRCTVPITEVLSSPVA